MNSAEVAVLAAAMTTFMCGCTGSEPDDERTARTAMALTGSGLRLQVNHGEDWSGTNNEIKPYFRVHNDGSDSVALSELRIRYWYTREGSSSESSNCYWAQIGCSNLTRSNLATATPVEGADHYFEVGFTTAAGQLPPGANSGEMKLQFYKTDWSNYDENNDFSYVANRTSWADAPEVSLYHNGVLVWGTEPGGGTGPSCTDGIQNGDETDIDCGGSCSPCSGGGDAGAGGEPPSDAYTYRVVIPAGYRTSEVALAATHSLRVNDRAQLTSRTGFRPVISNVGTGTTNIGADARVGDIYAGGSVLLRERAAVVGAVVAAGVVETQNVEPPVGAVLEGAEFQTREYAWTIAFPASDSDVRLEPGDPPQLLNPGAYRHVELKSNTTLQIKTGTYYMDSLRLEPDSTLVLDSAGGRIRVYVRSGLTYRGRVVDAGADELVQANLLLAYAGTGTVDVESPLVGTLVAPSAQVNLKSLNPDQHVGAVAAESIELFEGTPLRLQPLGLRPQDESGGGVVVGPEVQVDGVNPVDPLDVYGSFENPIEVIRDNPLFFGEMAVPSGVTVIGSTNEGDWDFGMDLWDWADGMEFRFGGWLHLDRFMQDPATHADPRYAFVPDGWQVLPLLPTALVSSGPTAAAWRTRGGHLLPGVTYRATRVRADWADGSPYPEEQSEEEVWVKLSDNVVILGVFVVQVNRPDSGFEYVDLKPAMHSVLDFVPPSWSTDGYSLQYDPWGDSLPEPRYYDYPPDEVFAQCAGYGGVKLVQVRAVGVVEWDRPAAQDCERQPLGLNQQNTPGGCQYYPVVTQLQEQPTLASAIEAAAFSVWIGPFLQQRFAARTDIPYITIKSNAWGSDFTGLTLAHEMWHVVQGSTGESSDPSSIANPNVRVADLEMSEELCQQLSNWAEPQAYRYQQFAEQLLAEPWVWCQYPDNPFPRIEKPTQCELNGGLPGDFCAEDAELPRDGCW